MNSFEHTPLPGEFITFLATNSAADITDANSLRETWQAWATLYDPDGPEPSTEAFEAYLHTPDLDTPLAEWRFSGQVRRSQQVILDAVGDPRTREDTDPLHIVAPPGAGKTLIGSLLAMKQGHKCLALAPTAMIRHQWARTADNLARGQWGENNREQFSGGQVSEDPKNLGDLTALTYQMLSVVAASNPFEDLARHRWADELIEAGRRAGDAETWLTKLQETNRKSYKRGLTRRARMIRRDILREDPTRLEEALHPNARELIDLLAAEGIGTIILDECHHLLDHWALVVHCLVNKLRARGIQPLLIGLTATLPSTEDGDAYDNYSRLLGEVDYELPTPAVVKEGNLAPYRSFAWFVTPTRLEEEFISEHEKRLEELIESTFCSDDGQEFLHEVLQVGEGAAEARLAQAFKEDLVIAEAACRMLRKTFPDDPLTDLFPKSRREKNPADSQIRLLARYALTRVLPDPQRQEEWAQIKGVLVDFGYHLTDRGIRRGRDPIDSIMATTAAKDFGVLEILRLEQEQTPHLRAVVVCDFAVHGHQRGVPKGEGAAGQRAGALRCHGVLAGAQESQWMRPVLVTANRLRVPTMHAPVLAPLLAEILGEELTHEPVEGMEHVSEVSTSVGSARVLAAVSELMERGEVSLIVGTRGLLGEGWDCPAVNTLIDLSGVATSASTQQLRGRTLRLDPNWPRKVAHNWTITCLLEPRVAPGADGDSQRLARKLSMVWGLSLHGSNAIVKGPDHTLGPDHARQVDKFNDPSRKTTLTSVNEECIKSFPPRESTYERWGIGEPYVGVATEYAAIEWERRLARPFHSGMTFEFFALLILFLILVAVVNGADAYLRTGGNTTAFIVITIFAVVMMAIRGRKELKGLLQGIKQFALPLSAYKGVTLAAAKTLANRGEVPEFGASNIRVEELRTKRVVTGYLIGIEGGTDPERAQILNAVEGLFDPISTPRFLLEVGIHDMKWTRPVAWVTIKVMRLFGYKSRYFGLPRELGRRREDAQLFAREWNKRVGPCTLHEIQGPQDMALLTTGRKQFGANETTARRQNVWA